MPKVVSRSAVSTSAEAKPTASSTATLRVYYCICGEFTLVIDKDISKLPRRKTDGAIILQSKDTASRKARVFKLNAKLMDPILVKREGGCEKLYRFQCLRCSLPIGYQSTPPPLKSGPYAYIYKGALTQLQGQVPDDAFDGERSATVNQTQGSRVD